VRKALDWSAVAEWQRLVSEWDVVSAEYDTLRKTLQNGQLMPERRADLAAKAEAARDRLVALKAAIDDLIRQKQQARGGDPKEFVIANIEAGSETEEAESLQDSPPKKAFP
jgi:hypothetical protein